MYLQNKYSQWYCSIIDRAKSRILDKNVYAEKHHIIPRSLGGSNVKSNIALVTAREHFICHLLLPKFTTGKDQIKMFHAAWKMCLTKDSVKRNYKITSCIYEMLKIQRANYLKTIKGPSHPNFGKKTGRTSEDFTPEWRENISISKKGKPGATKGRVVPDEQKKRQSATRKSKRGLFGFNVRPACRPEKAKAISDAQKGRKWIYFPETNERKPVNPLEVKHYLNSGWKLGYGKRKRPFNSGHTTGMKWIINPTTRETKFVLPEKIETYLNCGWLSGRVIRE